MCFSCVVGRSYCSIGVVVVILVTIVACGVAEPEGVGESEGDSSVETPAQAEGVGESEGDSPLGYTVQLVPADQRGTWQGWGTSLAWWAAALGDSSFQDLYADLVFSDRQVEVLGQTLPGLDMNIVRYNVGGGGRPEDIHDPPENVPDILPWYRDIDGYWVNCCATDPYSESWDFSRDSNQRNMLWAALDRGVDTIEFFANAPMWWMSESKSSAGGVLLSGNHRDFAIYLATVAAYAEDYWGVSVASVEPFNEPTSWWWGYPKDQEGCFISLSAQCDVLAYLRVELDSRGLDQVEIAASDENNPYDAYMTYEFMKSNLTLVDWAEWAYVSSLVDRINVHGYEYGVRPGRNNSIREMLRQSAGATPIWVSEYCDDDGDGITLAQTIIEDIQNLRVTAWLYWQVVEPYSTWGLVNADYGDSPDDPNRGAPTWVYYKHYVMAQFTRFIRPGATIIGSSDQNTVVAYRIEDQTLTIVTLNLGTPQSIIYDLSGLAGVGDSAMVTATHPAGARLFETTVHSVIDGQLRLDASANAIYSIVIGDALL